MKPQSRKLALASSLAGAALLLNGCVAVVGNADAPAKAKVSVDQPVKVIYHVSEGMDQATNALRNIRNHLSADPTAKISVVTHANGVDFLLDGAKDKNGNDYVSNVQELVKRGVDFRLCRLTLERRNIDVKRVIEEARLVPSGVAEVARLQAREGYVYLKP
ncbi:MAG: DsrE family protein [Nitrosomonadaceae bacterium]|nr:DsrE family protein [Nitrosomonadaceae bacterium]